MVYPPNLVCINQVIGEVNCLPKGNEKNESAEDWQIILKWQLGSVMVLTTFAPWKNYLKSSYEAYYWVEKITGDHTGYRSKRAERYLPQVNEEVASR